MLSLQETELTGAQSAQLGTLESKYGRRAVEWIQRWWEGNSRSFDWWVQQAHTAGSLGEFAD